MICCQQKIYNYFVPMIVFKNTLKGDSVLFPSAHRLSQALLYLIATVGVWVLAAGLGFQTGTQPAFQNI